MAHVRLKNYGGKPKKIWVVQDGVIVRPDLAYARCDYYNYYHQDEWVTSRTAFTQGTGYAICQFNETLSLTMSATATGLSRYYLVDLNVGDTIEYAEVIYWNGRVSRNTAGRSGGRISWYYPNGSLISTTGENTTTTQLSVNQSAGSAMAGTNSLIVDNVFYDNFAGTYTMTSNFTVRITNLCITKN